MSLTLMYITNNLDVALIAEKYGVKRIWIDLETIGKEERQKGMNTVKSKHSIDDIKIIKPRLTKAEMIVRVNPWNKGSVEEINNVIAAGADIIMLPMWKTVSDVSNFINTVAGRCKTMLLLETKEAVNCLEEVLENEKADEIHIGLNDLHLSYGLTFMFELLANGIVEKIINQIKKHNLPYGFGGIARLGKGDIPAEKIIMEHYRLGSTRAILSRSFCDFQEIIDINKIDEIFKSNLIQLRKFEIMASQMSKEQLIANQMEIKELVKKVVKEKRK